MHEFFIEFQPISSAPYRFAVLAHYLGLKHLLCAASILGPKIRRVHPVGVWDLTLIGFACFCELSLV